MNNNLLSNISPSPQKALWDSHLVSCAGRPKNYNDSCVGIMIDKIDVNIKEPYRNKESNWKLKPYYKKIYENKLENGQKLRQTQKMLTELYTDPHQNFKPSEHLIELVIRHMIKPDKEVLGILEELKELLITEDKKQNIENIITEEVESLITSVAKRSYRTKRSVQISSDNRFIPEICTEFIRRLDIDPYDPYPVLQLLYEDFFNFVSITYRERKWGKIIIDDSKLKLILKENAFTFPDITKVDNNKWIIT